MSQDSSIERKVKDFTAGFIAGGVQVLIGQPFDLVKVRLQTGQYQTPIQAFLGTLKGEGLLAFYKGTLAPLIGVGCCVSLQFYGFHETKRALLKNGKKDQLTLPEFYICGVVAGIVNAPVTSPVEQIRILLQTQKNDLKKYSGPKDAVLKIYNNHGWNKGLFRGLGITTLRDGHAYGVWFLTYEWLMRKACKKQNIERSQVPTYQLLTFGALAGNALWLSTYPFDVVKSLVQADSFGKESKWNGSSLNAAKNVWNKQGLSGFWRGLGPTLLRAVPCSAATFTTAEFVLRLLN
ncbi:hypothetical protein CANARDRAFT_8520 [[Candida] arabinofermentans NRRL YB-2248]|uniref:Mitochondrial carrier protein n=1 Tax=[Candida] arabinofermentans NRRL YB-2248 TaxID=983967 RepID=A0A1E4SYG0_9ASCO|nr:hypothetical protein CANARDRAFT_8520 [[Candida] arabinofermentans NRRL YB-2248]